MGSAPKKLAETTPPAATIATYLGEAETSRGEPPAAGEPLQLVARELNVTAPPRSELRDRALLAAGAVLKERECDYRDDEITPEG